MAGEDEIDLNSRLGYGHSRGWEGMAYELGSDDFFASDGFCPAAGVSPLRGTLPRQLQGAEHSGRVRLLFPLKLAGVAVPQPPHGLLERQRAKL